MTVTCSMCRGVRPDLCPKCLASERCEACKGPVRIACVTNGLRRCGACWAAAMRFVEWRRR